MNPELHELMALQGEIKIAAMKLGVAQEVAHELAAEVLDLVASSSVVTEAHRKEYKFLTDDQG